MKSRTFDIHIAANHISPGLMDCLLKLGYVAQQVIGGDDRVCMKYLLSQKTKSRTLANNIFDSSVSLIKIYRSFRGYIEQEAIVHDQAFHPVCQSRQSDNWLTPLKVSPCPPDRYKNCDIHITVPHPDQSIDALFRDAGFYYLSLYKSELGPVNVFSIQLEDIARGKQVWKSLLNSIQEEGFFEGFAKFEVTVRIKNFGFDLPPMILK